MLQKPKLAIGSAFLKLWVSALFALLAFSASVTALTRPLWFDEIATAAVSGLHTADAILAGLGRGLDLQPFTFFFATALLKRLPLPEEAGVRALAVIGFLIFCGAMFIFMRRFVGLPGALVSASVLMCSEGLYYASEARPYGGELAAVGIAACCWQARKRGNKSRRLLAGLLLSLAFVCALHYFGVFVVLMFGVADILAEGRRRRLDWTLLFALPATLAPTLLALPIIRTGKTIYSNMWAHPSLKAISAAYELAFTLPQLGSSPLIVTKGGHELGTALLLPLGALGAIGVAAWRGGKRESSSVAESMGELELAVALIALPAVTGLAAMAGIGAFTPRYVISCIAGTSILFGWLAARRGKSFALLVAAVLSLAFLARQTRNDVAHLIAYRSGDRPHRLVRRNFSPVLQALKSGAQVVVADGFSFAQMSHYFPPDLRSNLIYLEDRGLSLKILGNDSNDVVIEKLQTVLPFHVEPAVEFLGSHDQFLLAVGSRYGGLWLPEHLKSMGATVELIERNDPHVQLYRVRGKPYKLLTD